MKIVHINLLDFQGGAAKVANDIIMASDKCGYESIRFIHRPTRLDKRTVHIPFLQGAYSSFNGPFSENVIAGIHSTALLPVLSHPDFLSADIVHLHCIDSGYFSFLFLPFLAVKPLVWTIHDTLAITANCLIPQYCMKWKVDNCKCCSLDAGHESISKIDKRHLLQNCKASILKATHFTAVAPSKWIEGLLRTSIFNGQDIRMIYNGIDTHIFYPQDKMRARKVLNLPVDRKLLLFVSHGGLNNGIKGGKYLLEAFKLALSKNENWMLICVGAMDPDIERSDAVITIPYVDSPQTMADYYSAADVFVSTSICESFGLTVSEALACGTPIVAFAAGGVPEIVEHGKSGYLVKVGEVNTLYLRIKEILETPVLANFFGLHARKRAENLFSVEQMGERYLELYGELCGDKK